MKKANYLARQTEKQAEKGKAIPLSVATTFAQLQQYSDDMKKAFTKKLPLADFSNVWVVKVEYDCITISVDSATMANHLRMMSDDYLRALIEQSERFRRIKKLKFITTYI